MSSKGPFTLLALDGGGVKGISSLHVLKAVMDAVREKEGGEGPERLPVDYFDLAAGTSTGGLMALMLFRLRMSTSEVIKVYEARAKDIFSPTFLGIPLNNIPGGHWLAFKLILPVKAFLTGQEFSNAGLRSVIHDVVQKHGLDENERALGGEATLVYHDAHNDSTNGARPTAGKMFMCATIRDKGECILLRSYATPPDVNYKSHDARLAKESRFMDHIDITTAALATSAAPLYLPEVRWKIPNEKSTGTEHNTKINTKINTKDADKDDPDNELIFWDGGLLNNNPINELWDARYDLVGREDPAPKISFVLSIGCSWNTPKKGESWGIVQRFFQKFGKITSFMTNTEAKSRDFWRYADRVRDRHDQNHDLHYLRLNAPTDDVAFDMADCKIIKDLVKLTNKYLDEIIKEDPKNNDITKAASLLVKIKPDGPVEGKLLFSDAGVPSDEVYPAKKAKPHSGK